MTDEITLTDWRGNTYTVGTTIFYPRMSGRSCEIQEGQVIEIWEAVFDNRKYRWVRFDADNPNHQGVKRETRVKIQPGRGSRGFYRDDTRRVEDEHGNIVRDEQGHAVWEKVEARAVTLAILENITVVSA
ncbi:hypothetical protein [Nonomuraea endophytica]|uniref:hypothetical protein n=1 Tax=Nonomuraea endophytica TaxID=714136 RepID=UPI0037C8F2DC